MPEGRASAYANARGAFRHERHTQMSMLRTCTQGCEMCACAELELIVGKKTKDSNCVSQKRHVFVSNRGR
jgi:hypothetical protein